MSAPTEVRSYRVCFDLERRIHRIDRWRIPLPWGLPLRGLVYALVAFGVMVAAGAVPGVGSAVTALPAPLRLAVIPAGVAVVLWRWRLDGRPAHQAVAAIIGHYAKPRTLRAYRRAKRGGGGARYVALVLARDGEAASVHRGRVRGPARVAVRGCGGVRRRRGRLIAKTRDAAGDQSSSVNVAAGEVLELRP